MSGYPADSSSAVSVFEHAGAMGDNSNDCLDAGERILTSRGAFLFEGGTDERGSFVRSVSARYRVPRQFRSRLEIGRWLQRQVDSGAIGTALFGVGGAAQTATLITVDADEIGDAWRMNLIHALEYDPGTFARARVAGGRLWDLCELAMGQIGAAGSGHLSGAGLELRTSATGCQDGVQLTLGSCVQAIAICSRKSFRAAGTAGGGQHPRKDTAPLERTDPGCQQSSTGHAIASREVGAPWRPGIVRKRCLAVALAVGHLATAPRQGGHWADICRAGSRQTRQGRGQRAMAVHHRRNRRPPNRRRLLRRQVDANDQLMVGYARPITGEDECHGCARGRDTRTRSDAIHAFAWTRRHRPPPGPPALGESIATNAPVVRIGDLVHRFLGLDDRDQAERLATEAQNARSQWNARRR